MRTPEKIAEQIADDVCIQDGAPRVYLRAMIAAAIQADRGERWNKNHERACNVYGGGPCTCGFSPLKQRVAELESKLMDWRLEEHARQMRLRAERELAARVMQNEANRHAVVVRGRGRPRKDGGPRRQLQPWEKRRAQYLDEVGRTEP